MNATWLWTPEGLVRGSSPQSRPLRSSVTRTRTSTYASAVVMSTEVIANSEAASNKPLAGSLTAVGGVWSWAAAACTPSNRPTASRTATANARKGQVVVIEFFAGIIGGDLLTGEDLRASSEHGRHPAQQRPRGAPWTMRVHHSGLARTDPI